MSDNNNWREEAAKVLKTVARDGLPEPRDLDVALDAIECAIDAQIASALKWRDAINDALTNWLSPIEDHEAPADALQRLIRLEVMAALDPKVSQSAADLVAAARKEWLEELNHDTDALKWRDAIDGLRTLRWNDPVRDHETPLRAVQRLLNSELTAMALNPAIHKAVKAEITQAKREALEEAARRLEELHKNHKYNPQTGEGSEHDTGYYRAIAEGVAHIRALKGEGDE
jgi:histone H3/H4